MSEMGNLRGSIALHCELSTTQWKIGGVSSVVDGQSAAKDFITSSQSENVIQWVSCPTTHQDVRMEVGDEVYGHSQCE